MLNLIFFFFSLWNATAENQSLYSGKVAKIQEFAEFDLSTLKGQKSLWYFFQPGCESCRKQSLEFACLPKDLKIFAVGVLGTENAIKKEFRYHQSNALALFGGEAFSRKWNIQQTPTVLWVDSSGKILWRKEYKLDCSTLRKLVNE